MAWNWTTEAAKLLRGGHTVATRVDVLHSGSRVYQLVAISGGVGIDATRAVRRNVDITMVDPTGSLTRGDIDDLLNPHIAEIAPHRGVRTSKGDELAPLGVFGLTGREVEDSDDRGLVVALSGQDRAMWYQNPMSSSLAISGGTPIEEAIVRLLSAVNPGVSILTLDTGFTCGPLIFPPDSDVWREAQKLAESVGAKLYHDQTGEAVLALAGPAADLPVATYSEGDGVLLDVQRQEDSDTIRNVVVAENPSGTVRVVVEDADPTSPTYVGGNRRKVYTLVNQHFGTTAQATQAATAWLAYELGRSETVQFTATPDPGRDVDEVVTVNRPRAGLVRRGVVTSTVRIPLDLKQPMQVGCRQSRLAPDGAVLKEPPT